MDKRLCLWDKSIVKCNDLQGHNGSISKVKVDEQNVAISASYDSSLLIWNLDTLECSQGLFNGHTDAVTEFDWRNSLCVSGDRKGGVAFWDINTGKTLREIQAHASAVSKICFFSDGSDNLIATAGLKDGKLNIFDMRTCKPVSSEVIHKAAINFLEFNSNGILITGSADKTLKAFSLDNLQKPALVMNATDAVFCGETLDSLVVTGCGDGNMFVFDITKGSEPLYGYGADPVGALHCLRVTPDRRSIVTGGDSG
jgi:WD40 repeat protein